MKFSVLLPLAAAAATATAFVLPDEALAQEILVAEGTIQNEPGRDSEGSSWWDEAPSKEDVFSSLETTFKTTLDGAFESITSVTDKIWDNIESTVNALIADEDQPDEDDDDGKHGKHGKHGKPGGPHHGHHHLGNATKTIYELITESKHTTRFAKALEEYPEIAELLKDTKANYTLFVPTDEAVKRLEHYHKDKHGSKKPSKEFILALLKYHVAPGLWPVGRLAFHHTVPTAFESDKLGGAPLRLRVRASLLGGLRINFFPKVVAANVVAKNGFIHAVDNVLLPPPAAAKIISLVPGTFSTLSLAFEKTELGKEIYKMPRHGGTIFAPTNRAWAKLGPAANAFLFSKRGEKYLAALLKYHVVLNETFFSDAFLDHHHRSISISSSNSDVSSDEAAAATGGRWHFDLPSLLHDKPIGVDVRAWLRFISVRVNGWTSVQVQDVVTCDGVIQVVDSVLIPPHKRKPAKEDALDGEELSVEELVERLEPYVGGAGAGEEVWGDL